MRHPEHEENQVGQVVPPEIGYKKPPKQERAFAADTAERTGQSKKDINRHVSRADALGDDLQAITGTSLDKGVELDALKAMPPEERAPFKPSLRTNLSPPSAGFFVPAICFSEPGKLAVSGINSPFSMYLVSPVTPG
jgi:hypothetical protein|tara:strand:- start:11414 stop:11824 length:411 start_codon:yes stop_codon:yes gene_type:complete